MAIPNWLKQVAAILYDDAGNRIKAGSANGLVVEGPAAVGSAVAGNPVAIGATDGTSTYRAKINPNYSGILVAPAAILTGADGDPNSGNAGVGYLQAESTIVKLIVVPWLFNGATWDRQRTPSIFKPQNAVAVGTEAAIWQPASGKKFRLMGAYLQSSVAGNLLLKDNAGTILVVIPCAAGGDATQLQLGNGILSVAVNNPLTCIGPAASTVSGMVWGTEE